MTHLIDHPRFRLVLNQIAYPRITRGHSIRIDEDRLDAGDEHMRDAVLPNSAAHLGSMRSCTQHG